MTFPSKSRNMDAGVLRILEGEPAEQIIARWIPTEATIDSAERMLIAPQGGVSVLGVRIDLAPIRAQVMRDLAYVMHGAEVWKNASGIFRYEQGVRMDERIVIIIGAFILNARGSLRKRTPGVIVASTWVNVASSVLLNCWNAEILNPRNLRGGELPLDAVTAARVINWWWGRFGGHDAERARISRARAKRELEEARLWKGRVVEWALGSIRPRDTPAVPGEEALEAARNDLSQRAAVRGRGRGRGRT